MQDSISNFPQDSDWHNVLTEVFASTEFVQLNRFVASERQQQTIFPPSSQVFRAFDLCGFAQTKVVILGQDPYHALGQADGLSFSVPRGVAFPPSLRNIFRELVADLGLSQPVIGDLSSWASQGVLLLNSVLTVREGAANSHAGQGWETFTDEVIRCLGRQSENRIVFLLWGKQAERKRELISDCHSVIASAHPSPLSAYRGFFGSRPFSRANQILESFGKAPIQWQTLLGS